MKKVVAMMLSLVLALGLMAGCGQKDAGKASGGTKTIESLKIAFSPYADADQITTATEPLEALLKAKLLEKGYDVQNIDMTVGTSYTAVGEALSAGSADIGFISGGNYVLFSDDCDVLLTALRYGINKDSDNPADWNDGTIEENTQDMTTYYRSIILAGPSAKGQELLKKVNAGEELTWDDLNSATWSVLAPTSASGYIYPSLWLQEHYGKTIADLDHVVQSDSHSTSLARLATGQADVMVSYGHIRIKNAPIWQEKLGGTAPMVEQTGIIGVTEGIYNDMIAYSKTSDLMADEAFRKALGEAFMEIAKTDEGTVPDLAALSAATGTDARTLEESFESSPGYGPEMMTLSMIEWFLYIIAALVTGAFFLVWTIQRAGDIAVMRAMGATKGFLLRDSLGQAVVILALSIGVGVALALALGAGLEASPMPYATELAPVLTGAALLFVFGLIGATVAVFRVTRTDPLTALGENR